MLTIRFTVSNKICEVAGKKSSAKTRYPCDSLRIAVLMRKSAAPALQDQFNQDMLCYYLSPLGESSIRVRKANADAVILHVRLHNSQRSERRRGLMWK